MVGPLAAGGHKKVRAGERLAEDRNFMGFGHKVIITVLPITTIDFPAIETPLKIRAFCYKMITIFNDSGYLKKSFCPSFVLRNCLCSKKIIIITPPARRF